MDKGTLTATHVRTLRSTPARTRALLAACAERPIRSARSLTAYHDTLLFLAAYPPDAATRTLVEAELERVAGVARAMRARRGNTELLESGIDGTIAQSALTLEATGWLDHRFPGAVDIAWDDGSAGPALDALLAPCVARVEGDGLMGDRLTTQEWIRLARGDAGPSELSWLLAHIRRLAAAPEVLDAVFDRLELYVQWRLDDRVASTTFGRFPARRPFYDKGQRRRSVDVPALLAQPLPAARRLSPPAARHLLDVARAALLVRGRETDALTFPNPRELSLFSLERGVDVALFGVAPARRLPIESFFGFVAARNRVPIAYGGAWVFMERAEIGINVFEPFRGGESAHLFALILRVYHRHFGVRRFVVDPFQFGAGNADGLRSAAFWFYYRLGFRPNDPERCALAAREWAALQRDRDARTPRATLRRLAEAELVLTIGDAPGEATPDLSDIALAVTHAVGARFGGDRQRAVRWARRRVARLAGTGAAGPPPGRDERDAFERLSLLAAIIPDLDAWPAGDRRRLAALLHAKGGPRERDYAGRLQRHARFREALAALAAAGRRVGETPPVHRGPRTV